MPKKINYADMFTLRKDGRYMGYWKDQGGVRHAIYDRDPEKLYNRIQEAEAPKAVLFAQILDEWQDKHGEQIGYKATEAYAAPCRRIKERFGDMVPADITAALIQAYISELGKTGYARRTVQMSRDILNMTFNHAILQGYVTANPCAAVSIPKGLPVSKRDVPSDEALEAVRGGLAAPFGLFAFLCLYSGTRRGEALALRYEDIDRKAKLIHIHSSVEFIGNSPQIKSTKTASGIRDIPLFDALASSLPKKTTGYIFPDDNGGLLSKMQYRRRWLAYCKAIGYDITAHQLRHGFATILYEAGIADKDAQELLGHSNITLTRNVYTHIRQVHRDDVASKLNDFINQLPGAS